MAHPVRRGGRGNLADGTLLTWSLAEGARGRRWRASRSRDGRLEASLLLEVDTAGRPARLELASADGLLTLHPSHDQRELHGNVVTPGGIRHLAFTWSPRHELVVDGFPIALMAAAGRGRDAGDRPALTVDTRLECRPGSVHLRELSQAFAINHDGTPTGLTDGEAWPLEK